MPFDSVRDDLLYHTGDIRLTLTRIDEGLEPSDPTGDLAWVICGSEHGHWLMCSRVLASVLTRQARLSRVRRVDRPRVLCIVSDDVLPSSLFGGDALLHLCALRTSSSVV